MEHPQAGFMNDVRTECIDDPKKRTYGAGDKLTYPPRFATLAPDQQRDARILLKHLPESVQQVLLDEWEQCCRCKSVRNPAAYLFGLFRKAQKGEFRPSLAQQKAPPRQRLPATTAVTPSTPSLSAHPAPETAQAHVPVSREVAQAYIRQIRKQLRLKQRVP